MSNKRDYIYAKTKHEGIFFHPKSNRYLARKKINGIEYKKTFSEIRKAKEWRSIFNGKKAEKAPVCSTLKEVWEAMNRLHFPKLSNSTKQIWFRRYEMLKKIEHYRMNEITSTVINEWLEYWVDYYKSDEWQASGRGKLARCNLKNELNLFVTIFNWYKAEDEFEEESKNLITPIRQRHKLMTYIKDLPQKDKKITPEEVFRFLDQLPPLYRDLALVQYYCAGRIGEVAGIQIKNINIEKENLKIKETCLWCQTKKTFLELKPFPKNRETRDVFLHDELKKIIQRRLQQKQPNCDFLFHVEGKPLNYGTIQINYRSALRKAKLPYSGTHILRHGMATLARKIGGGLDSVMAMTGHKTAKLAERYSRIDHEIQREVSQKVLKHLSDKVMVPAQTTAVEQNENVLAFPKSLA